MTGGGVRRFDEALARAEGTSLEDRAKAMAVPRSPSRWVPHVDRSKTDPQIVKAAEGMEAMFLDYMMHVMRQTVPKGDLDLESSATDLYRGMLDSEYAQKAAHAGGVGLADTIIAYMNQQRYTLPRGSDAAMKAAAAPVTPDRTQFTASPKANIGGTHAGQSAE